MTKTKTIFIVSILILTTLLPLTVVTTAQTPDYDETWTLPSDGSEDSTDYYSVTRDDASKDGKIHIQAWKDNKTVKIDFTNIKSVKLYLNATDVDLEQYKSYLNAVGGEIKIILTSDVSSMDFTFTGVPQFAEAKLDGEDWTDYNYYSSNNTIDFSLTMSTHEISLIYGGWINDVFVLVITVAIISMIVKSLGSIDLKNKSGGNY